MLVYLGTVEYMQKYAEGIKRVSGSFGPVPTFDEESVKKINEVRNNLFQVCDCSITYSDLNLPD